MPAAAVIPAPIAYTKVVAVKKLVVGSWSVFSRSNQWFVLLDVLFYLVARVCSLS